MKYTIPAVLFAGGKSSRMGKDKALLPFGKYSTLSEFQYQKLTSYFNNVYLIAKENKFLFEAPLILDQYKESSPLVGIVSIFEYLQVDEVFILSVDAPFIEKEIIDTLLQQTSTTDATIAKSPHGLEPLCGIYRRSILPLAKAYLDNHNYKLQTLLNTANTDFIYFEDSESFFNLNHPKEYKEALQKITS